MTGTLTHLLMPLAQAGGGFVREAGSGATTCQGKNEGFCLGYVVDNIGDYVTPELIGGGKIPMIANLIQVQMLALDNRPLGSALAVTAMAIVALVSIVFLLINRRFLKVRS